MRRPGFTLVETLIYLAILAFVLPTVTLFMVNTIHRQEHITTRISLEENASMVLDMLRYELQHAQSVTVSTSTFNTSLSRINFTDRKGVATSILVANDVYVAGDQNRTIQRVQMSRSGQSSWLTSNDITIRSFTLNPVRNASGDLTGINVSITLEPHIIITTDKILQSITISSSFWLPPYVQEL